ncbi:CBN-LIN-15A protein [Caenorhabditis brenneri]|uniref:CBN-LIN-15A protein n=1 Tax=Caenorhabditis brenneri TaxID=135651 RepID=G0MAR6_CAEBE|nr:CBN-LIN-15A protein [Caenorhabditis brenneri]
MNCFRELVTHLHSLEEVDDQPTEELGYDLYKTTTEGDVYMEGEQYDDYTDQPSTSDWKKLATPKMEADMPSTSEVVVKKECPDEDTPSTSRVVVKEECPDEDMPSTYEVVVKKECPDEDMPSTSEVVVKKECPDEDMPSASEIVVKEECPDEDGYGGTTTDSGAFDPSKVKAEVEEEEEVKPVVTGVIPEGTVAIPREMMEKEDGITAFARLVREKLNDVAKISIGEYLLNTPFIEPGPHVSPCIICTEPVASYHGLTLKMNYAVKLLMAAVMSGIVDVEDAAERIKVNPLRMCRTHTHFIYDWMSYATGCNSADSLEQAPIGKIKSCIDVYRDLKKLREYQDGQLRRFTPVWSFKHAVRSYFRGYETKYPDKVSAAKALVHQEEKRQELPSPVKRLVYEVPPSASLQEILKAQNIVLNQDEEKHLLEALRIPERQPRKPQPKKPKDTRRKPKNKLDYLTDAAIAAIPESMKNPTRPTTEPEYWTARSQSPEVAEPGPDDLYYQHHKQNNAKVRDERYSSYPEEIRKMMAPIDQFYDQGSGANRAKITAIREQKRKNPDPQPVTKKRTRAAPINFTKLAQQMMQKIDSRTLSDSTSNANFPSTSAQSSSTPVPSTSAPVPAIATPARSFPDPSRYMRVVPKPGQKGVPKYVLRPEFAAKGPAEPMVLNPAPIPDWIQALPVIPERRRQPEPVVYEDYQRPQYVEEKPSIDQDWRPQHDVLQGEQFYKAGFDTNADFVHYGYEEHKPEIGTRLVNPMEEVKPDYVQLGHPASHVMAEETKPEQMDFHHNGVNIRSNEEQKPELANFLNPIPQEEKPDVQPKSMYDRRRDQNLTLNLRSKPIPRDAKPKVNTKTFLSRRKMDREEENLILKLKSKPVEKLELRPPGGVVKAPEVKSVRRNRPSTSQDTQLPGYNPNMTIKELMQARLKAQREKLNFQNQQQS